MREPSSEAWRSCRSTLPLAHSWEALGADATPQMLDGSDGVGHSPAATAAWLRATLGGGPS